MSSKISLSFFLQSKFKEIKVFDENIPGFFSIKWTSMGTKLFKVQKTVSVQTANCSKGFKPFQTMNKGLIK